MTHSQCQVTCRVVALCPMTKTKCRMLLVSLGMSCRHESHGRCISNGATISQKCHSKQCVASLQIEKSPKPQASCAMPAAPGMKIKTETPVVKKAREGVMEFLLVSDPFVLPGQGMRHETTSVLLKPATLSWCQAMSYSPATSLTPALSTWICRIDFARSCATTREGLSLVPACARPPACLACLPQSCRFPR